MTRPAFLCQQADQLIFDLGQMDFTAFLPLPDGVQSQWIVLPLHNGRQNRSGLVEHGAGQCGCAAGGIGRRAVFCGERIALSGLRRGRGAGRRNGEFVRRFREMERLAAQQGCAVDDLSAAELDKLWKRAKEVFTKR